MMMPITEVSMWAIAPALIVLVTAAITLLGGLFVRDMRISGGLALLGLVAAGVLAAVQLVDGQDAPLMAFGLQWIVDTPASALSLIILLGAALSVLVAYDYLAPARLDLPEFYPLLLLSTFGGMVMVHAGDLIVLLLGLEILSLAAYAMAAWRAADATSEEAGMKYFLLGAFASAVLVYGIALTYGAVGAFDYGAIAGALADGVGPIGLTGGLLVLAGLGFKAALAPFHQWAPDVYTGAPTPVTTFMSIVVKTAAFGALLRVSGAAWQGSLPELEVALAVLVALTVVIGNFAALLQSSVKRMLAYSAVAHAGYLGLAVLATGGLGTPAAVWYLLAYTLMNAGAFAVLTQVADANDRGDDIEAWEGLGRRRPLLAVCMTLFMLSLAGIPPLAGFTGKVLVFQAALDAGWSFLAVLAILTAVVALVYYFRVVAAMWFREGRGHARPRSPAAGVAIGIAAIGTVGLGLFPNLFYALLEGGRTLLLAGL